MKYYTIPISIDFEVKANSLEEAISKVDDFVDKIVEEKKNIIEDSD